MMYYPARSEMRDLVIKSLQSLSTRNPESDIQRRYWIRSLEQLAERAREFNDADLDQRIKLVIARIKGDWDPDLEPFEEQV